MTNLAVKDGLVLLHLSDIHFRWKISGTNFDVDKDLRDQLELDAVRMKNQLGHVDGILITGDIAFAGRLEEYAVAAEWLLTLCRKVGCPVENVWTAPGNHDVDRTIIEASPNLQLIHKELRPIDASDVDDRIDKFFRVDQTTKVSLWKPLQNYNEFATKFQCNVGPDQLFWEHDLILNDYSKLRLRGVTSTLVSNGKDDDGANRLILGSLQCTATEEDGVEYLLLCHHPPQWLKDQDKVEDALLARVRIQLFGHKHRQRMVKIGESLRLSAGAVHPSRKESDWKPRYNYLVLRIAAQDQKRVLEVDVAPRIWGESEMAFVPEVNKAGSEIHHFNLELRPWTRPVQAATISPSPVMSERHKITAETTRSMNSTRRLTYRFLTLPYHTRVKLAEKFNLLEDEDRGLQDLELFKRFFRRAKDKKLLSELWKEVEVSHGDGSEEDNPFANE